MMQLELAFLQGCCSSGHGQGAPSSRVLLPLWCSSLYSTPPSMMLLPLWCSSLQGAPPTCSLSAEQERKQGREVQARHNFVPSSEDIGALPLQSMAGLSQITLTEAAPFHSSGKNKLWWSPACSLAQSWLASFPIVCGISIPRSPEGTCMKYPGRDPIFWKPSPNSAKLCPPWG